MRPVRGVGGGLLTASAMEEEEEDLFSTEYPVSASEDEEEEETDESKRKHQKLLEAISSLDGQKRRRVAERTEAGLQVSEFGITSGGAEKKISLSDVIDPQKTDTPLTTVKEQLDQLKEKKSVDLPLSKGESEKIQRIVSYQTAAKEVAKWEPVVQELKHAEQLVFPMTDEPIKPAPIEEMVAGWTARTPLEMEIFNILNANKQPITDPLLTPVEKASLKAMSLEEARLRRAELQKARALQSYYEAKARRAKKIKSKTYHKHLKKERRKDAIKQFEELRKTDPEAALEELEKIEKDRIKERMSLKHQNSGKWAKSKAIMAKYDDAARKAIQEQLQKNKELTLKVTPPSESEEEGDKEEETIPDFVNDAQMIFEGPNPWMTGKLRTEAKDSGGPEEEEEEEEGAQGDTELGPKAEEEEEEEKEEESEEEALLKEFEDKRRWRKEESAATETDNKDDPSAALERETEEKQLSQFNVMFQKLVKQNRKEEEERKKHKKEEEDDSPSEEEAGEDQEVLRPQKGDDDEDEGPLLMGSLEQKRSLEEVEALGQEEHIEEPLMEAPAKKKKKKSQSEEKPAKKSNLINREDILPAKAKKVEMPLIPTMVEGEDEEEVDVDDDNEAAQKMIIQEAFAGDDVISDFVKEKRKAEEDGKPQDVNLVLPGWGEWGGTNLKVSKRKRRRFIIKGPPAPPRKDKSLPGVIISEKRNVMLAGHQVNVLPFPFNNKEQFESSIRSPVGNTWNTEKAVQKLTAPKVVTKAGHIIEPITQDDFQKYTKAKKSDPKQVAWKAGKRPQRGR